VYALSTTHGVDADADGHPLHVHERYPLMVLMECIEQPNGHCPSEQQPFEPRATVGLGEYLPELQPMQELPPGLGWYCPALQWSHVVYELEPVP
jgi:hypothetical protein